MKNLYGFTTLFILLSFSQLLGQSSSFEKNGWELNAGFGYDQLIKDLDNNSEIIRNEGNYANFSATKYWNIIGVSASTRYTFNSMNTFKSTNFSQMIGNNLFFGFNESKNPLQRIDLAVGPMLNIPIHKEKLYFKIGAEGGYSFLKGGNVRSIGYTTIFWEDIGYIDNQFSPFVRPKAEITFQMSDQWALGLVGHYAHYFNDTPQIIFNLATGGLREGTSYTTSSWGGGVTVRYILGKKTIIPEEKPVVIVTKNIQITVLDKETKEPLKNTKINLVKDDVVISKGTTDENGVFTFLAIPTATYQISGELNEIKTPVSEIFPADFETSSETLDVKLLHFDPRFTLNGLTYNKGTETFEGLVYVILKNLKTNKEGLAISDKKSGTFSFQLEPDTDYSIFGRKDNFISEIETVSTKGLDRSTTLFKKLSIDLEKTEVGKIISLDNIYYDLDKAVIREDASKDLLKLVQFMADNPAIKIELDSHTDSRGTSEYNRDLSQRRAQSVVNFLINRGIERERLIAKGFGESRLVNNCSDGVECSEEEHQKNRRTEFMVID